jgi:hypothetical protein
MSKTNPPAFQHIDSGCGRFEEGMLLRDYFAAKAMPNALVELWAQGEHTSPIPDLAAKFAYEVADAMIQARDAK